MTTKKKPQSKSKKKSSKKKSTHVKPYSYESLTEQAGKTIEKQIAKKKRKKKSTKSVSVKAADNVKVEKVLTSKKKVTGGKNYVKNGNPKGGKRNGSGRKVSETTRKTRAVADKLSQDGELTPLEYMLNVLRETTADIKKEYDSGDIDSTEYLLKLETLQRRKDTAAEKAAPYIHPRLSNIEAKVTNASHEKWIAMLGKDDE